MRKDRTAFKLLPFFRMVTEKDPDTFLTETQLSEILGRSISALQKDRCYKRGVPFYKMGGMVRYRVGDLLEYIDQHRIVP